MKDETAIYMPRASIGRPSSPVVCQKRLSTAHKTKMEQVLTFNVESNSIASTPIIIIGVP